MFRYVMIVSVLISSVAFAHPPVDPDCDKLAQFARALDTIKAAGYTTTDSNAFVVAPKVSPYPVQYIQSLIYSNSWTPQEAYAALYGKCALYGYSAILDVLKEEQATADTKQENSALKTQLVALTQQVADLSQRLEDTQKQLSGYLKRKHLQPKKVAP